jgi:uncharacterized protein YbjT (DUF2867 family)
MVLRAGLLRARVYWRVHMDKLILVTGATGYIASRLIPRLLDSGCRVRALARDPLRLEGRAWSRHVDMVRGNIMDPSTLPAALNGVHTAYYLIHNMSHGRGYTSIELDGARNFAKAAQEAGIQHIIYLGGLADPQQHIAPHMRSRIETGRILREGKVPVTEFRAGVITGSGSISFEMIRFMTELFPIVPGPAWMRNKSQPIATRNVIDYLVAALENPNGRGGIFEIGGPEVTTYDDLMKRYARARGLKRRLIMLPHIPLWFMAFGVGLMTPVPYSIAYALIDGLSTDSIVKHPQALKIFPEVKLIDLDAATRDALEKTHPSHIERVWVDGRSKTKSIKHEGCFILHASDIHQSAGKNGGKFPDSKGEHHTPFGKLWLEFRVEQNHISITLFFSPRGLPGFLYWYLLYPFHWLKFHGLLRNISKQSESA